MAFGWHIFSRIPEVREIALHFPGDFCLITRAAMCEKIFPYAKIILVYAILKVILMKEQLYYSIQNTFWIYQVMLNQIEIDFWNWDIYVIHNKTNFFFIRVFFRDS